MANEKYTSKQDALNKGLVKKDGVLYKQSLIELWHAKGWLDMPDSPYSSDDRLRCGLKLALDYQIISRENLHSGHVFNDKVDISRNIESRSLLNAKDRYNKAIRSIPAEFWPVVRCVCIDEKEPAVPPQMSERQKTYFNYMKRIDLCRGLDRIISHTLKLNKYKNIN